MMLIRAITGKQIIMLAFAVGSIVGSQSHWPGIGARAQRYARAHSELMLRHQEEGSHDWIFIFLFICEWEIS